MSPPNSLRRSDRSEGPWGTSPYRCQKSARVEGETVAVDTFIGRMGQHVLPKGGQRVRSYGGQAPKTFTKSKGLMQKALAPVQGLIQGALKSLAPLTYRPRSQQRSGRDPWRCPHGQRELGVWRIWHPPDGRIHAERTAIERGQEASQTPRAAPTGSPGRTVWPATRGISRWLPGLW